MSYLQALFIFGGFVSMLVGIVCIPAESYLPQWLLQLITPNTGYTKKVKNKLWLVNYTQVPRSWFSHFYVYALILQLYAFYAHVKIFSGSESDRRQSTEFKYLEVILSVFCADGQGLTKHDGKYTSKLTVDSTTLLASFLLLLQVTRRVYENFFVSIFSGSKMSIAYYILGYFHYTGSTLAICAHNFGLDIKPNQSQFTITYLQYAGILLFLYGWYQQLKAHMLFADLRKPKKNTASKVETLKHQIPVGGLFEQVSCPNYWAEILIYISMAVVFTFSNSNWNSILFFVISNQIVSALITHKYYLSAFPDYPKQRKAIIPYVL